MSKFGSELTLKSKEPVPLVKVSARIKELVWLLVMTPERAAYCPTSTTFDCTNQGASPAVVQGRCDRFPDSNPSVNCLATKLAVMFKLPVIGTDKGLFDEFTSPVHVPNWSLWSGKAVSTTLAPLVKSPEVDGRITTPPNKLVLATWTVPPPEVFTVR